MKIMKRLGLSLLMRGILLCLIASFIFLTMRGIGESLTPWSQATITMLTNLFYKEDGRNQVTVVLFRELDLTNLGEADPRQQKKLPFPVPYQTHVEVLEAIALREPKALMIDYAFVDQRKGDDVDTLLASFCGLKSQGINVYLATFNYWSDRFHGLRSDLFEDAAGQKKEVCFQVVPVNYKLGSNGLAQTYDLLQSGPRGDVQVAGALRMYMDAHKITDTAPFKEKMDVLWGSLPPKPGFSDSVCKPVSLSDTVVRLFTDGPAALKRDCAYSNTLSVWNLMMESSDQVEGLIKDKFVFYGAAFQGTDDWLLSPVHGNVSGVYLHAMALDNLITLDGHYKQLGEHRLALPPGKALTFDFLIILVGITWHLALVYYRNRRSISLMAGDVLELSCGTFHKSFVLSRVALDKKLLPTGYKPSADDPLPVLNIKGARRRTRPDLLINPAGELMIVLKSNSRQDFLLKQWLVWMSAVPYLLVALVMVASFHYVDNYLGMLVALCVAILTLFNCLPNADRFISNEYVSTFKRLLTDKLIDYSWLIMVALICLALFYWGDMGPRNFWAFAAFLSFTHFLDGKLASIAAYVYQQGWHQLFQQKFQFKVRTSLELLAWSLLTPLRSFVWMYREDIYRLNLSGGNNE